MDLEIKVLAKQRQISVYESAIQKLKENGSKYAHLSPPEKEVIVAKIQMLENQIETLNAHLREIQAQIKKGLT